MHIKYNFAMPVDLNSAQATPADVPALTPAQLVDLVGKLERDNVYLRRQVAGSSARFLVRKARRAILSQKVFKAFLVWA